MKRITRLNLVGLAASLGPGPIASYVPDNSGDLAAIRKAARAELDKASGTGPFAVVMLNEETYSPGAVLCTPGQPSTHIAFAGTLADQPITKITGANDQISPDDANKVRIEFEGDDDHLVWQLREGELIRDDGRFEALGYLHGSNLEMNCDGTVASLTPLPDQDQVPFGAIVRCE